MTAREQTRQARAEEMYRMRVVLGWSVARVARVLGLSESRTAQIINAERWRRYLVGRATRSTPAISGVE